MDGNDDVKEAKSPSDSGLASLQQSVLSIQTSLDGAFKVGEKKRRRKKKKKKRKRKRKKRKKRKKRI